MALLLKSQHAERSFDKIENTFNGTFAGFAGVQIVLLEILDVLPEDPPDR